MCNTRRFLGTVAVALGRLRRTGPGLPFCND